MPTSGVPDIRLLTTRGIVGYGPFISEKLGVSVHCGSHVRSKLLMLGCSDMGWAESEEEHLAGSYYGSRLGFEIRPRGWR